MRYLGGLRGTGVLTCRDEAVARADYDLDGFLTSLGEVTASGEIRMAPDAMRGVFGRTDLKPADR